jgi:hypothetical protein
MNRRDFLALSATITLVPALGRAETIGVDYTPEVFAKARAGAQPVFLIYGTDWCSTCAAQERAISALKAENPDYAARITFIHVNWDRWKGTPIATDLKIPRRSTLVVLKGDTEIGRIVASPAKSEIKALMDKALAVA